MNAIYPIIVMANDIESHRTGGLSKSVHPLDIADTTGFPPNIADDYPNVTQSWGFRAQLKRDGEIYDCAIWDYIGNRWSTYGPREVFEKLFPGKVTA